MKTFAEWFNEQERDREFLVDWLNGQPTENGRCEFVTEWALHHTGGHCLALSCEGAFRGVAGQWIIATESTVDPSWIAECSKEWPWILQFNEYGYDFENRRPLDEFAAGYDVARSEDIRGIFNNIDEKVTGYAY